MVNADDFGMSAAITDEIARCFAAGAISSTTIMANMPAFEYAVSTARDAGFADRLGIHLNLTCGAPLSEPMRRLAREDGTMAAPEYRVFGPRVWREAAYAEIRAQTLRVLGAGITPTHFDSHEHVLNSFLYAPPAVAVAREFSVRRMRLTRNAFYARGVAKSSFKALYNGYLRSRRVAATRWFTDVKPYFVHRSGGGAGLGGVVELMCHPGMTHATPTDGHLQETDLLLGAHYREMLGAIDLVPYGALISSY